MTTSSIDKDTFDMDSLLNQTVSDLADVPEFKPFAAGAHRITFSLARSDKIKEGATKPEPVILGKMKLISTEEMVDPTEPPMEVGTESNVRFQLDNEFGQGEFKKVAAIIAEHYKLTSLADVLSVAKDGIECLVITSNRSGKKREDGSIPKYTSIVEITVL
jgi:hypothetical protein